MLVILIIRIVMIITKATSILSCVRLEDVRTKFMHDDWE